MSGAPAEARAGQRCLAIALQRGASWWRQHPVLASACGVEAFLLGLVAVAPIAGVAQTISPLARAWPILLAPARLIFGPESATSSVPPERGWPALALYTALLVGASCVAALPLAMEWRPADAPSPRGGEPAHGGPADESAPEGVPPQSPSARAANAQALENAPRRARKLRVRIPPSATAATAAVPLSSSPSVSSSVSTASSEVNLSVWIVLGVTAVLGLTLVLLPALPSDDVFSYILYGRISAIHSANPLLAAPSSFPGDPFLRLVFWQGTRSVYGPVWLLVSAALTHLAEALGGSLATYVLLYKLLGLGAHLANTALIWATLGRLAPRRQLAGTLLYAWNPLCLLEFCASAHNDALMLTFALAGVYCLVRRWEVPALVSFGLAIGVKYVLLALVPLYLAVVVRERLRRGEGPRAAIAAVAWRAALVLGVVALTAAPFWAGPRTFGALLASPPAQQLDNSLLDVAQWPLRAAAQAMGISRVAAASVVQSGLKLIGLALFASVWLWALWRTRGLESMLRGWGWVLLAYVVVGSGWFWPWYATWIVAVAALVEWSELSVAALLLAGGATTLYAFLPLYSAPVYGVRALVVFGPALGYLLWRHRRRRVELRVRAACGGWAAWSNRWGKARVIGGKGK